METNLLLLRIILLVFVPSLLVHLESFFFSFFIKIVLLGFLLLSSNTVINFVIFVKSFLVFIG